MSKISLKIAVILFLSVVPTIVFFYRLEPHLAEAEKQDVASSMREFSRKVKAQELTHEEIGYRLDKSAIGQEKIDRAWKLVRPAALFWLISILTIPLLQWQLINKIFKTHNNTIKKRP